MISLTFNTLRFRFGQTTTTPFGRLVFKWICWHMKRLLPLAFLFDTRTTIDSFKKNTFKMYPNQAQLTYEISDGMKNTHEVQFYQDSYKLQDALKNLQLVLLVDHSGFMHRSGTFQWNGQIRLMDQIRQCVPSSQVFGRVHFPVR